MKKRALLLLTISLSMFQTFGICREAEPEAHAASNSVHIWEEDAYRYIQANGIPEHTTGQFPNRGNPNRISTQNYAFRVALHPVLNQSPTEYSHNLFGIALNGIPFDPGTAEYWNNDRRSGWNYEALSGKINLGIDQNHAHVQPTGAYHYHGVPTGFVAGHASSGPVLIGYAADGFPIYYDRDIKSSYRIKRGARPSGPGGAYDGTFVQDYEYVPGLGNLDECNGRLEENYRYYLTDIFPFVPRCHMGNADASFIKERPHTGGREERGSGMGRRLPEEAVNACLGARDGQNCGFQSPQSPINGTCHQTPDGQMACIPSIHPR